MPLTGETRGLIGARRLSLLNDGAALVNTARGDVIDQDALVRELVSGRIRAALDVFTGEPGAPAELLGLPNVILTPHIGSATVATREAMARVVVDNVLAVGAGRAGHPGLMRRPALAEIQRLDPVRDHARIVYLDACFEFPFDVTRALELAFFRTFAVPSIAELLASTGEFTGRPLKRYDDTDLLISTFVEARHEQPLGRPRSAA